MPELMEHGGRWWAVQRCYAVPDDAWHLELSEAVLVPGQAGRRLPGRTIVAAIVSDEDPAREPELCTSGAARGIPFDVARWFLALVAEEVARCRVLPVPGSAGRA